MKNFIIIFFCTFFSISIFACSCAGQQSFCNHILDNSFLERDGIVCIAETSGNIFGDYYFSAVEMKLIDLLYGDIQPGKVNYLNSDSTFWILLGAGATCYDSSSFFKNAGEQFVMAPSYGEVYPSSTDTTEKVGYSLYLCSHDFFKYEDVMIGPMIHNSSYFPDFTRAIDTVSKAQLSQFVQTCLNGETINENDHLLYNISISPNPNQGIFKIQSSIRANYNISNINSQQIIKGVIDTNTIIDLSHVPSGVYYVNLQFDDANFTKKIVKM